MLNLIATLQKEKSNDIKIENKGPFWRVQNKSCLHKGIIEGKSCLAIVKNLTNAMNVQLIHNIFTYLNNGSWLNT